MRNLLFLAFILLLVGCNSPDEIGVSTLPAGESRIECGDLGEGWSVPKIQVVGGGVGKDGIPAIEDPQFISAADIDFLLDEEIVIGVNVNGEFRAYPHRVLERHEIVNDFVGNQFFSITFCPLTGTSLNWQREVDNSFGVSGLLHNSNLIAYDRKTDTNYAQIFSQGINGENICSGLEYYPAIEMSWSTWLTKFPDSKILSLETGFSRNYGPPTSSFQWEGAFPIFPVHNEDDRLPNYERVLLVVIGKNARAYRLSTFKSGTDMIVDFLAGSQVTLIGSQEQNYIVPYLNGLTGARNFSFENDILVDTEGNSYNLFGESISGPDKGEFLEIPYSMMGYWFAVSAFYPDVEIFLDGEL